MKSKNNSTPTPPKIAFWIIERLLNRNVRYSALGDFEEEFYDRLEKHGKVIAKLYSWMQMLFLFPAFVKDRLSWMVVMLKDYNKVAFRNIQKSKGISFINLAGLAVGMTCTILIMLWVFDELSFDRFHKHSEHIYRVNLKDKRNMPVVYHSFTPNPVGRYLKNTFPEVVAATKIMYDHFMVSYGDKSFNESQVIFTDPSFFEVFTFPVVRGDIKKLKDFTDGVVISKRMAQKYFGSEDPYGKTITLDTRKDVWVAAVIEVPSNSDFRFDLILPFSVVTLFDANMLKEWEANWQALNYQTFIRVHPHCNIDRFGKMIAGTLKKHVPERDMELVLQPLSRIHLYNPDGSKGDMKYIYIFLVIAGFILIIACINFMGLATARAEKRVNEVGLRKAIGARRHELFTQFFYESILLIIFAFLLSVILVEICLPFFNSLVEKQMSLNVSDNGLLAGLALILVFTSILCGTYPSVFLSSFTAANLLKGRSGLSAGKPILRKGIVVVQFSISVFLLVCTFVIYSQLRYILNKDIGINKEHLIYLLMEGESKHRFETVKTELNKHPGILSSAACYPLPADIRFWAGYLDWQGNTEKRKVYFVYSFMDYDCIKTLGMTMKEGRAFSKALDSQTNRFIVNEEAASQMGVDSPVGKELNFWGRKGQIIGVVKNFHFHHMSSRIAPLVLVAGKEWKKRYLMVRVRPGSLESAIDYFRAVWTRVNPGFSFEYGFLEDNFRNIYRSETRLSTIFKYFSMLAILISCLGLFGLATFVAERRAKEVGIRKVLGSSVKGIVLLLTRDFLKLVCYAILIAWPIALFVMKTWLQEFAYHVKMDIWIFIASGFLALVIATLTVGYQAVKSAFANPVDTLKYE